MKETNVSGKIVYTLSFGNEVEGEYVTLRLKMKGMSAKF